MVMREWSSDRSDNPSDVGPRLGRTERTYLCRSMCTGGDVAAAEMEEVGNLVMSGEEALCPPR